MRWIKHLTNTWDDEKISSAIDSGGLELYGFWWRLLEIIGKQMDSSPKTYCQYTAKIWGNFAGISAKKFQKFAGILEENGLIFVENGGREIKIDIPNLSKYRDEWSKKKMRDSGENTF